MKNLNVLVACLLLVVAQSATASNTAHTSISTCGVKKVLSTTQVDNQTNLPLYLNTIAEISLGYEGAMLTGTIKLNNGAILHVKDYATRDDNEMKTWSPGDALFFTAEIDGEKGLILSAKRLGAQEEKVVPYLIFDVTQESQAALTIVEINDEGKFIKLNDNSIWEFSWYHQFSTKKWTVGQHVLIQGNLKKNSYEVINLSAPTTLNAAKAKASFVMN